MNNPKESVFVKFAEKFNFPDEQKLMVTLKATAFRQKPKKQRDGTYINIEITDEQMYALLIVSDQYGLNPFSKEIYAYPDKDGIVPVVGIDGWLRMVNQHKQMDGMEFVESKEWIYDEANTSKPCPSWIECVIYRKDRSHPISIREYFDEVYRQPFSGIDSNKNPYTVDGPWQTHTKRMLRHKALIQCARVAFSFVGIYDQDEAERIIEGQVVVETTPVQTEPSLEAKRMAEKLINRAHKAGAWQAALDYAGENFSNFNLDFITTEISKAKERAESVQSVLPNDPVPDKAKTARQQALDKAKETLN